MATNGRTAAVTNGSKGTKTSVRLQKRATAEEIIKKVGGGKVYLRKLEQIRSETTKAKPKAKPKVKA